MDSRGRGVEGSSEMLRIIRVQGVEGSRIPVKCQGIGKVVRKGKLMEDPVHFNGLHLKP